MHPSRFLFRLRDCRLGGGAPGRLIPWLIPWLLRRGDVFERDLEYRTLQRVILYLLYLHVDFPGPIRHPETYSPPLNGAGLFSGLLNCGEDRVPQPWANHRPQVEADFAAGQLEIGSGLSYELQDVQSAIYDDGDRFGCIGSNRASLGRVCCARFHSYTVYNTETTG